MKATCMLWLWSLLLSAVAADQSVWLGDLVGIYYADGRIVAHQDSSGNRIKDLGNFPAKVLFPLDFAVTTQNNFPDSILAANSTGWKDNKYTYTAFSDQHLYIDYSPGIHPVGFVANNKTLSAKQTTWGFYNVEGFIVWRVADSLDTQNLISSIYQQCWAWVETSTKDVYQLYWNQTRLDEAIAGKASKSPITTFARFYGQIESLITYANLTTSS